MRRQSSLLTTVPGLAVVKDLPVGMIAKQAGEHFLATAVWLGGQGRAWQAWRLTLLHNPKQRNSWPGADMPKVILQSLTRDDTFLASDPNYSRRVLPDTCFTPSYGGWAGIVFGSTKRGIIGKFSDAVASGN